MARILASFFTVFMLAGTILNAQDRQNNQIGVVAVTECCAEEWKKVVEVTKEDYPHLTRVWLFALAFQTEKPVSYVENNCIEIGPETILCRLYITGTLQTILMPEEFLGVIAHEVGHIANKDFENENPEKRSLSIEKRADLFAFITLRRLNVSPAVILSALEKLTSKEDANAQKEKDHRIKALKKLLIR
ncbi:MAG: hypothetical protein HYX22_00190 [Candidatus Yanofskybacteria bacterium]|nr:hypothetical protein [Candidatus Yanofskybacteria bacterium]